MMEKIFQALSSTARRKVLAYLSKSDMTAGEIAERFEMSKPALSKHLDILKNAGLIISEKKGQFVHYSLTPENLTNTLNSFVQQVCPVSRPLINESEKKRKKKSKIENPKI